MHADVERGWNALETLEEEGLIDAFIEAAACERVDGEPAQHLAKAFGYGLDESGVLVHTHRSSLAHAAAAVTLFETLEPMIFKLPFYHDAGLLLRLYRAPYFELLRIETHVEIGDEIMASLFKVLPQIDRRICITEAQLYALLEQFQQSLDIGLALHDFAFKAPGTGMGFHYGESFFQKHPLNPQYPAHQMLYWLAREQKISTLEFSILYGAFHAA